MPWPFLLKQAQISARRILPSRRWVRSRMTMRAPGVAEWATAAMRRTGLDTQYALRGAFRACGLAVRTGGLTPSKSFVGTSCAPSSRRPIGTTMPSRWPQQMFSLLALNHAETVARRCGASDIPQECSSKCARRGREHRSRSRQRR